MLVLTAMVSAVSHAHAQIVRPADRARLAGNYTRYIFPTQCLVAARREALFVMRAPVILDTASYADQLRLDTIPTSAIRAARACTDQLVMTSRSPLQALPFAETQLMASRDSIAAAAGARYVRTLAFDSARSMRERVKVIRKVLDMYQTAAPRRIGLLSEVLAQMPATDAVSYTGRHQMLGALMQDAFARGALPDVVARTRDAFALIDTSRFATKADVETRIWYSDFLRDGLFLTGGPSAVVPWLEPIAKDHVALESENDIRRHWIAYADTTFRVRTPAVAPALAGVVWLHRPDTMPRPMQGKVTLLIDSQSNGEDDEIQLVRLLRRLDRAYGTAGLEIVWARRSQGYFRGSSVLTFAEEAKVLDAYYFKHLGAPGMMVFEETAFTYRPDGKRLVAGRTRNQQQYGAIAARSGYWVTGVSGLIDRKGRFVPVVRAGLAAEGEAALGQAIAQALKGDMFAESGSR